MTQASTIILQPQIVSTPKLAIVTGGFKVTKSANVRIVLPVR